MTGVAGEEMRNIVSPIQFISELDGTTNVTRKLCDSEKNLDI